MQVCWGKLELNSAGLRPSGPSLDSPGLKEQHLVEIEIFCKITIVFTVLKVFLNINATVNLLHIGKSPIPINNFNLYITSFPIFPQYLMHMIWNIT